MIDGNNVTDGQLLYLTPGIAPVQPFNSVDLTVLLPYGYEPNPVYSSSGWGTNTINIKRIMLHYIYENGEDRPYMLDVDVNDLYRVKQPINNIKKGELFAAKEYLMLADVEGVIDIIGEIVE